MNTCLIIGANGLIGRRIAGQLSRNGIAWQGTCFRRPEEGLINLDVRNQSVLKKVFSNAVPAAVFYCANFPGGVNACEQEPECTREFYVNATQAIGELCNHHHSYGVFFSTDYVFDGTKGPYHEEDVPNPLNVYGNLKLEAEQWILKNVKHSVVIRTTNVYGWDPDTTTPNYIMGLYQAVSAGKVFQAPSFLWGNPTYVGDLAAAALELWQKEASGIFHVVGSSFVNRLDWAQEACEVLELDRSLVQDMKEPRGPMAPRPLKSNLNTEKFTRSYSTILHDVGEGLKLMKADMQEKAIEQ